MPAIIIPDEIKPIDQETVPQKIQTIYDYIVYMKEQIEFWAGNRTRDITTLQGGLENALGVLEQEIVRPGDEIDIPAVVAPALLTSSSTAVKMLIPTAKVMSGVSGFSVSELTGGLRIPTRGYLNYMDSGGTLVGTWDGDPIPYDDIQVTLVPGTGIQIRLQCDEGWRDPNGALVNNIPITGNVTLKGIFLE